MRPSPIMLHAHGLAEVECTETSGPVIRATHLLRAAFSAETPSATLLRALCDMPSAPRPHAARRPPCFTPHAKELLEATEPYLAPRSDEDVLATALVRAALDLPSGEGLLAELGVDRARVADAVHSLCGEGR